MKCVNCLHVLALLSCVLVVYTNPPDKPLEDPGIPNGQVVSMKGGRPSGKAIVRNNKLRVAHQKETADKPKHSKSEAVRQREELDFVDWIKEVRKSKSDKTPPMNDNVKKALKDGQTSAEKVKQKIKNENNSKGKNKNRPKRSFILENGGQKWTKCVIPYQYDAQFENRSVVSAEDSAQEKAGVEGALDIYRKLTGFRFVPYTGNNSDYGLDDNDYLNFMYPTGGCWSYVGNIPGWDGQNISACTGGTAVHEVGHTLGLMHENQHPVSMEWMRSNTHEVTKGYEYNYFRRPLSSMANENKMFYDISSEMHYGAWYFSKNYQDTLQLYDEDDAYLLGHRDSTYYMFRDLQIYHDCFAEFSSCATPPTCLNGGYVSVIDGDCKCRCPGGLDPDTYCASETLPLGATNWPTGTYTLFKTTLAYCPTGWQAGSMVQWSNGWTWDGGDYASPGYHAYKIEHDVCTKTDGASGSGDWPSGSYCILRYGGVCPAGFTEGTLETYGLDQRSGYTEVNEGILPDGPKDKPFQYIFCCRTDGSKYADLEGFEVTEPMILFPTYWTCQTVKDTYNKREFVVWKNNDTIPVVKTGTLPKIYSFNEYWLNLYYCVYFPVIKASSYTGQCGEIRTLSASETGYTFNTPNYPGNFPITHECFWRFESPAGTIMRLDFTDFDIPYDSSENCDSYVEVRYWYPATAGFKFCGNRYNKTIWTKENYLTVKFVSDPWTVGKGFSATIDVLPHDDKTCYQGDGSQGVFAGTLDYGENFATCLSWDEVLNCPFNQFDRSTVDDDLTGHNYCRNVGIGRDPWCYRTADNCQRQMCDACQRGTCFDLYDNCEDEILNDPAYCTRNVFGTAAEGCRFTCGLCAAPATPASLTSCPEPGSIQGICPETTATSFNVGDTVTYTCPANQVTQTRTCTSEGTWTDLHVICGVCPTGWSVYNKKCYKWLGYKTILTHAAARSACASKAVGARLPKVLTNETEEFLQDLIDYEAGDMGQAWIGVVKDINGTWVYEDDNTVPTYSDWQIGYPWGGSWGGHDCAIVNSAWNSLYELTLQQWKSVYCDDEYYVICELELSDATAISSCVDRRVDCEITLTKTPDMCSKYPDYSWHNCRHTCGMDVCQQSAVTCTDDASLGGSGIRVSGSDTIQHADYLEYTCNAGYFHTFGHLKRACLPSGALTGQIPVCSDASSVDSYVVNSNIVLKRRPDNDDRRRIVTANNLYMKSSLGGTIKSWSFYSNFQGHVAFAVLRPNDPNVTVKAPYINEAFTVVGTNVIYGTAEDRAMRWDVPVAERITILTGDYVGIYHENNEISLTECNEEVTPEHSEWMVSNTEFGDISAVPTNGTVETFTQPPVSYWSIFCRIYSLQYEIDPQ